MKLEAYTSSMKRFLLIPVAVGLIAGFIVSAQTPKPANLNVKAADSTQSQPSNTVTAAPTQDTTPSAAPVVTQKPVKEPSIPSSQPVASAPTDNQVSLPAPITITAASVFASPWAVDGAPNNEMTRQIYCDLTYSDGSTGQKQVGQEVKNNNIQESISEDCQWLIGRQK